MISGWYDVAFLSVFCTYGGMLVKVETTYSPKAFLSYVNDFFAFVCLCVCFSAMCDAGMWREFIHQCMMLLYGDNVLLS